MNIEKAVVIFLGLAVLTLFSVILLIWAGFLGLVEMA